MNFNGFVMELYLLLAVPKHQYSIGTGDALARKSQAVSLSGLTFTLPFFTQILSHLNMITKNNLIFWN